MCNILKKSIKVADKRCGSKALDNEEISFGPKGRLMMIDLDNIICVLKGKDVIHNVVNIFLKWTPLKNSKQHVDCFCEFHECIVVIVA